MELKKMFQKEKPTVEYYKKLDKFVIYITIISIVLNTISFIFSPKNSMINGLVYAGITVLIYAEYTRFSEKSKLKLVKS